MWRQAVTAAAAAVADCAEREENENERERMRMPTIGGGGGGGHDDVCVCVCGYRLPSVISPNRTHSLFQKTASSDSLISFALLSFESCRPSELQQFLEQQWQQQNRGGN